MARIQGSKHGGEARDFDSLRKPVRKCGVWTSQYRGIEVEIMAKIVGWVFEF